MRLYNDASCRTLTCSLGSFTRFNTRLGWGRRLIDYLLEAPSTEASTPHQVYYQECGIGRDIPLLLICTPFRFLSSKRGGLTGTHFTRLEEREQASKEHWIGIQAYQAVCIDLFIARIEGDGILLSQSSRAYPQVFVVITASSSSSSSAVRSRRASRQASSTA